MLLGWPWLKLTKVHHNQGDNTLTITSREQIVTLSTIKRININSSLQLKNLDDEFDWEERLSKQKEEQLYDVLLKLWLVEEVTPKELYF